MDARLERLVRRHGGGRCEYCRLPQSGSQIPFEIDHIIARKHGGRTVSGNLAVTCVYCNAYKGPNIAGLDPATGMLTRLFHPPRHKWHHHFRYDESMLVGRTAIGRATIAVLHINHPTLVALRDLLSEEGLM